MGMLFFEEKKLSTLTTSQTFHLYSLCKYETTEYVHKLSWVTKSAQLWRHFIKTTQTDVSRLEWKGIVQDQIGVIYRSHLLTSITTGTSTINRNNKQAC